MEATRKLLANHVNGADAVDTAFEALAAKLLTVEETLAKTQGALRQADLARKKHDAEIKSQKNENEKLDFEVASLKLKLKHATASNAAATAELSVLRRAEERATAVYAALRSAGTRLPPPPSLPPPSLALRPPFLTQRAAGGGCSGALAMLLQVVFMMWLRTTVNYQYRHGGSVGNAFATLYAEGGVTRFYQGLGS